MKLRNLLFYIVLIGGFSIIIYFIIQYGNNHSSIKMVEQYNHSENSPWKEFILTYKNNLNHPLAILLLQIITIMVVVKIFGFLCKKIGQPAVIGEIIAGIFLGPSFVGMYFPEFSTFLFPIKSLSNLQFLSQIGLILFMFVVGMELDLKVLKNRAHEAMVISLSSILFPFTLGLAFAFFIFDNFAPENVTFLPFGLFIGISMSITAFPVLARIIQERGMAKTKLGSMIITCAAIDDLTAWCVLAAVIAIVKAGYFESSLFTMALAAGYVLIMLLIVRPFLKKFGEIYTNKESLSKPIVAVFFITLLISAYSTEVIGIHAIFGAFMAGVIMPSNMNFRNIFIEKVEDVSLVLLLPLFFVFTGLRTQIGLLNESHLWFICGIVILLAITGKFIGGAIAAKFVGQSWRNSAIIGAFMNTRGLMELVVLNIGYDLGVLSPEIFVMMVIMALLTTLMTGPALDLINMILPEKNKNIIPDVIKKHKDFNLIISFGSPIRGKLLLRLANCFIKKSQVNSAVTALHLSPSSDLHQFNVIEYEQESFRPIKSEAKRLNLNVTTLFKATPDIDAEISKTANQGNFDLLLVGIGRSVYEGTFLGKFLGFTKKIINPERIYESIKGNEKFFENNVFDDRTRQIIKSSKLPLGIFVDKEFLNADHVFCPINSLSDFFIFEYIQKLIVNSGSIINIQIKIEEIQHNMDLKKLVNDINQANPGHIVYANDTEISEDYLSNMDLIIISIDTWKAAFEEQSIWLTYSPSVLIMKQ